MLKIIFLVLTVSLSLPIILSGVVLNQPTDVIQAKENTVQEMSPDHAYEYWDFINEGDYQGWQVENAISNVRSGWLNIYSPKTTGTPITLSLPNHPVNMYMPDMNKRLLVVIRAKRNNVLSAASISSNMLRGSFTFTYPDGTQAPLHYFSVPFNNEVEYVWLPIIENDPIVADNFTVNFLDTPANVTLGIDYIAAMEIGD